MTGYELQHFWTDFEVGGNTAELWKFKSFDTPWGQRQELQFETGDAVLMFLPDRTWSLVVIQSKEQKLYDHVRYILQSLFYDWDEATDGLPLTVTLRGMAYQAVVLLKQVPGIDVEENYGIGTMNARERKVMDSVTLKRKK